MRLTDVKRLLTAVIKFSFSLTDVEGSLITRSSYASRTKIFIICIRYKPLTIRANHQNNMFALKICAAYYIDVSSGFLLSTKLFFKYIKKI